MTVGLLLAVAVDHEEGIIDGDAQTEERDDVPCEVVDVRTVEGGQPDGDAKGTDDGEHTDAQRQRCCDEGAENDEQHGGHQGARSEFSLDQVVLEAQVKGRVGGQRSSDVHGHVALVFEVHACVIDRLLHVLPVFLEQGLGFASPLRDLHRGPRPNPVVGNMSALVGFVNLPRPDHLDRGILLQVRENIVHRSDGGGIARGAVGMMHKDVEGLGVLGLRVTKISTEGAENLA